MSKMQDASQLDEFHESELVTWLQSPDACKVKKLTLVPAMAARG